MKSRYANSIITVLVIGAVIVFSVNAFAGKGYGRMGRGEGSQGQGYGFCGGPGVAADLSEEDVKKMEEQRNLFFEATADIRQEVYQKRLSLRSELAKKDPDIAVAKTLQKEISAQQAQLADKRLDYIIEMKKINPYAGGRLMGAGHSRRGMGDGHMRSGRGRGWHHDPLSGQQDFY